jgi:O-Antigen ligase
MPLAGAAELDPGRPVSLPAGETRLRVEPSTRLPLYALISVLAFVPPRLDLPGIGSARLAFGAAIVITGIAAWRDRFALRRHPRVLMLPVAVAIGMIPAWLVSGVAVWDLRGTIALLGFAALAAYVSFRSRIDPEAIHRCVDLLLYASPVLALVAVYQTFIGTTPIEPTLYADVGRVASILGHPAIYGTYAGAVALLAFVRKPRFWPVILMSALLGLALSGARSATLALAVAFAVFALVSRREGGPALGRPSRRPRLIAGVVALLAVTTAAALPGDTIHRRAATFWTAFGDRAEVTEVAWRRITDNPRTFVIGRGPGAAVRFWATGFRVPDQPATFDNAYVTIWYELGLLGLVALLTALLVGMTRSRSPAATGLLAFLALNVLTYNAFNQPTVQALGLLAVGLLASAKASTRTPTGSDGQPTIRAPARALARTTH